MYLNRDKWECGQQVHKRRTACVGKHIPGALLHPARHPVSNKRSCMLRLKELWELCYSAIFTMIIRMATTTTASTAVSLAPACWKKLPVMAGAVVGVRVAAVPEHCPPEHPSGQAWRNSQLMFAVHTNTSLPTHSLNPASHSPPVGEVQIWFSAGFAFSVPQRLLSVQVRI